ncbi:MAG: integrase zinc binding domain-containing protein, partial [Bacteroidota bacterium]
MMIFQCQDVEQEIADSTAELALANLSPESSITMEDIRQATLCDPELKLLATNIQSGFPETHHLTNPAIRQYFNVKDELWFQNDIIMFRNRVVVPNQFRQLILQLLHFAHQGVAGMRSRADMCVYWPGISSAIKQTRSNCRF